jgi:hypothetical protein
MPWLKVVLTRLVAGEIVHIAVKVANPDAKVDHLLVVLIVFFVSSAFGVTPGSGAGDPQ